jgi:hypothetical protein
MDYPSEFSPEARDRIEKEKIRVCQELLPSSAYDNKTQDSAIRCIMRIFLSFAKEACALRRERGWTIERVEDETRVFLRKLMIEVLSENFSCLWEIWIDKSDGSILRDAKRKIKASAEWKEYQELLLTVPLGTSMVQKQPVDNLRSADKQHQLTDREKRIWEVIRRGSKGRQYCRELDSGQIEPKRVGIWAGCPRSYVAAYDMGKPWRHRIEDEKSKVKQKTKLAERAKKLASE